MKKKIIVGLLVISALSFAENKGDSGNKMRNNKSKAKREEMMSKLSDQQKQELGKLMEAKKEEMHLKSLDVKEKKIELEKELAKENKDWNKIEQINKEMSSMEAEMKLDGLKFRDEVEKKYGIKMRMKNMNHGSKRGMKGGKSKK